jgi:hypothetical protein
MDGWQGYQLPEPSKTEGVRHKAGMRLRPVWVAAGALMIAAAGMVTVALLRPPALPSGNPGVIAAQQFITEYKTDRITLVGGTAQELGERLMSDSFEIEADMTITSDALPEMGLPMERLVMGVDVKYDMNDLGMKVRLLGLEYASAHLIGNELVISTADGAYSLPLTETGTADLTQSMGMRERALNFLPVPAADEALSEQLFSVLAQSVPDEYTRVYTDSVYSPLDRADAEMTVIETTLDKEALKAVASNMDVLMQKDPALREKLGDLFHRFTSLYKLDLAELDGLIADLMDGSALSEEDGLNWKVYQRQGRYVGLYVQAALDGASVEACLMGEMKGRESHETLLVITNGELAQNMDYTVVYEENHVKIDGTMYAGEAQMVDIAGDITMQKNGSVYNLVCSMDMEGEASGTLPGTIGCSIDADIHTGEDLKTLKEDSAWNDVYSEEWERLDGTLLDLILPQS